MSKRDAVRGGRGQRRRAAEGRVYMVSGEDWDGSSRPLTRPGTSRAASGSSQDGPAATVDPRGVRLVLTMEGETVAEVRLHRLPETGIEKNMEYRIWTQGVSVLRDPDGDDPMLFSSIDNVYCLVVE